MGKACQELRKSKAQSTGLTAAEEASVSYLPALKVEQEVQRLLYSPMHLTAAQRLEACTDLKDLRCSTSEASAPSSSGAKANMRRIEFLQAVQIPSQDPTVQTGVLQSSRTMMISSYLVRKTWEAGACW